jgi:flagellar biosynthesis protein FliR
MSNMSRALIAMAIVWWVIPISTFLIVGPLTGHARVGQAVGLMFAAMLSGGVLGYLISEWRRGNSFEGAICGAFAATLITAAPIAIIVFR